jgi:hypothetical protein
MLRISVEEYSYSLRLCPGRSSTRYDSVNRPDGGTQEKDGKNRKDLAVGWAMGLPKMITATSTEQSTPNSYAFLKSPFLRWMGG